MSFSDYFQLNLFVLVVKAGSGGLAPPFVTRLRAQTQKLPDSTHLQHQNLSIGASESSRGIPLFSNLLDILDPNRNEDSRYVLGLHP